MAFRRRATVLGPVLAPQLRAATHRRVRPDFTPTKALRGSRQDAARRLSLHDPTTMSARNHEGELRHLPDSRALAVACGEATGLCGWNPRRMLEQEMLPTSAHSSMGIVVYDHNSRRCRHWSVSPAVRLIGRRSIVPLAGSGLVALTEPARRADVLAAAGVARRICARVDRAAMGARWLLDDGRSENHLRVAEMASDRRMQAVKDVLHPRTVMGIYVGELVDRREDRPVIGWPRDCVIARKPAARSSNRAARLASSRSDCGSTRLCTSSSSSPP